MTYTIIKEIRIVHKQDGWEYVFTTDECGNGILFINGTVSVEGDNGFGIHIPKDCIQHFIDALEQLKWTTSALLMVL